MSDNQDTQTIVDACMTALKTIAASHGDELETMGEDGLEAPALANVTAAMVAVCANEMSRQIGPLAATLIFLEPIFGLIHRGMEEEKGALKDRDAEEKPHDDGGPRRRRRENKTRQGRRKTQH